MSSLGKSVVHGANTLLELVDLKLTRHREQDWSDPSTYIPFKETLTAAERAGMSVGEYIDSTYNVAGSTELTIKELVGLGVLHGHVDRVCEVGPGSGRYLEKVTALTTPDHYEVYETATPWANWLAATQRVTVRPTDGKTLASTADASVDLTHAHKVMVVVPFLTICRYLLEMMRVTREGGYVVFDLMTDECLPEDTLQSWIDSDIQSISYPSFITRQVVVDLFTRRGFDLVGTFFIPMQPGITQYFAFRRRPAATA
jgi:hypothetical protein